jgi:tRNA nucleotidyltransferase (CCA-adding enzyme)
VAIAAGQDTADLETAALLLHTIGQDGSCLSIKDLAITGSDLLALGAEPGPHIGRCMQSLLSLVQEELLTNTKEELMAAAKTFLEL